jgi:hypothetical protein
MPENSPDRSIPSSERLPSKSLRVGNYNYAGANLFMTFVVGPAILGWLVYLAVTGGVRDEQGQPSVTPVIVLIVIGSTIQVGAMIYSLNVPVLWVEIGHTLRYATLVRVHEWDWGNVQRIWFERDDSKVHTLIPVTLVKRHVLAIQVNEARSLRVLIPTSQLTLIATIMELHPRFKDSPYDEEPIAEGPEEEYWDESDESAWTSDEDD